MKPSKLKPFIVTILMRATTSHCIDKIAYKLRRQYKSNPSGRILIKCLKELIDEKKVRMEMIDDFVNDLKIGSTPHYTYRDYQSELVKCSDCKFCKCYGASMDEPYPVIFCSKKHWEGMECEEHLTELIECNDFEKQG